MATIELKLSPKTDIQTQLHEVLIRFSHGAKICQRAHTSIKIKKDNWQDAIIDSNKRKVIVPAGIKIPNTRIYDKNKQQLIETKNELERLCNYIQVSFQKSDMEYVKANYNWLQNTIDDFRNPEKNTDEKTLSFCDRFSEFIEMKDVSKHRKDLYKVTYRLLKRYELYKKTILTFDNFDSNTLCEIDSFATKENLLYHNPTYRKILNQVPESRPLKPRGKNTIIDIMKIIRTFTKWSKQFEGKDPFLQYEIGTCVYNETPYYLTIDERNHLYEFDFSYNKHLETQRDIFVFQCLVGCRVSDLKKFTKSNIVDNTLEYIAQKTLGENTVVIRVPLAQTAKDILEKYSDNKGEKLLPFISDQKYNDTIKDLLKLAGIDRMVTTLNPTNREYEQHPIWEVASSHMARRTFIGNLYKKVQDPNLIGSMSGHKEGSKAFARYRAIDDEIKKSAISLID